MARYVIFPGVAGSHADTPDTNLLDANTAHLNQAMNWFGTNVTIADQGVQADGWGEFLASDISSGGLIRRVLTTPDVTNAEHTMSFEVDNVSGQAITVNINVIVDGGNHVVNNVPVAEGVSRISASQTLTTGTVTELRITVNAALSGDALKLSKFCLSLGSDATFTPSLRIVGDVDFRTTFAHQGHASFAQGELAGIRSGFGASETAVRFVDDTTICAAFFETASGTGSVNFPTPAIGVRTEARTTRVLASGLMTIYENGISKDTGTLNAGEPCLTGFPMQISAASARSYLGDVYSSEARDGIDGPIVAIFDAEDIGL